MDQWYEVSDTWSIRVNVDLCQVRWSWVTLKGTGRKGGGDFPADLCTIWQSDEWAVTSPSTHYRSLRDRVFPVNHLHWYWKPNQNNQETEHTNNTTQKVALNSTTDTQKKPRLRDRTDRAWFTQLLLHRPGNGVGLFFQLWSPHWAIWLRTTKLGMLTHAWC